MLAPMRLPSLRLLAPAFPLQHPTCWDFAPRSPAVTVTRPDLAEASPELRRLLEPHRDRLDLELLDRALRFSAAAHRGQKRMSGEDFISHSIAVAQILAEQLLDTTSIAAALLHDVVEDSDVRVEDIAREFGAEIASIVDGLTKISHLTFRSSAEEQVENYRKLLLSIAKDARVIIIKLCDRLHNMRTLEPLNAEKRQRIALETREIYAPLAHRFGMARIKAELEDLAFKFLEPEDFRSLVVQVSSKKAAREQLIIKLRTPLEYELRHAGHRELRHHRATEAPLVDLPEDEAPQQGVRRDLRPDGAPPHREIGAGVLSRPRHHSPQLDAAAGAHQGLHRQPEVERVPVAAYHHLRPRRPAVRGADPHAGNASHRRVRHCRALDLQDRREHRRGGGAPGLVPPAPGTAAGHAQSRRNSWNSSRSTCTRTRSSSSRRRAT